MSYDDNSSYWEHQLDPEVPLQDQENETSPQLSQLPPQSHNPSSSSTVEGGLVPLLHPRPRYPPPTYPPPRITYQYNYSEPYIQSTSNLQSYEPQEVSYQLSPQSPINYPNSHNYGSNQYDSLPELYNSLETQHHPQTTIQVNRRNAIVPPPYSSNEPFPLYYAPAPGYFIPTSHERGGSGIDDTTPNTQIPQPLPVQMPVVGSLTQAFHTQSESQYLPPGIIQPPPTSLQVQHSGHHGEGSSGPGHRLYDHQRHPYNHHSENRTLEDSIPQPISNYQPRVSSGARRMASFRDLPSQAMHTIRRTPSLPFAPQSRAPERYYVSPAPLMPRLPGYPSSTTSPFNTDLAYPTRPSTSNPPTAVSLAENLEWPVQRRDAIVPTSPSHSGPSAGVRQYDDQPLAGTSSSVIACSTSSPTQSRENPNPQLQRPPPTPPLHLIMEEGLHPYKAGKGRSRSSGRRSGSERMPSPLSDNRGQESFDAEEYDESGKEDEDDGEYTEGASTSTGKRRNQASRDAKGKGKGKEKGEAVNKKPKRLGNACHFCRRAFILLTTCLLLSEKVLRRLTQAFASDCVMMCLFIRKKAGVLRNAAVFKLREAKSSLRVRQYHQTTWERKEDLEQYVLPERYPFGFGKRHLFCRD